MSTGGYHGSQRGEGDRRVEEALLGEPCSFGGRHQRLLDTDQGHWLSGYRLLDGHRGHGFDENHPSLLQGQWARQRAGQGVGTVWSLGAAKVFPGLEPEIRPRFCKVKFRMAGLGLWRWWACWVVCGEAAAVGL